jgi:hypothetical protein
MPFRSGVCETERIEYDAEGGQKCDGRAIQTPRPNSGDL